MSAVVIDTSIQFRQVNQTNAHVEMDVVDASGHYKPYEKYDTITVSVDPSLDYEHEHKTRFMDHLYVDPSINDLMKWEFQELYSSSDGKLDRSKFPF